MKSKDKLQLLDEVQIPRGNKVTPPVLKAILRTVANCERMKNGECSAAADTIGVIVNTHEVTVRRGLAALCQLKVLTADKRPGFTTIYRVNWSKLAELPRVNPWRRKRQRTPSNTLGVHHDLPPQINPEQLDRSPQSNPEQLASEPRATCMRTPSNLLDESLKGISKESNTANADLPDSANAEAEEKKAGAQEKTAAVEVSQKELEKEFNILWEVVRRKEGKIPARKAYFKARKEHSSEHIYRLTEIYYSQDKQTQFLKHPASFFNSCLEDDPAHWTNNDNDIPTKIMTLEEMRNS